MLRQILTAVGVAELLSPDAFVRAAERIALDNPDDCELESWVAPVARLEGLLFLLLVWRSDASYSGFKEMLGVVGIVALLHPRAYVDYGAEIAYTDGTRCEWRPWVYPGTRLVGLAYVLVALDELRTR